MKKKHSFNLNNIYSPKSENKKKYVSFLENDKYIVIVSFVPAGTGKTLFGCQKAISQLITAEINKIIITAKINTE
jgi:phosphate starvation-inducible protein PhoH